MAETLSGIYLSSLHVYPIKSCGGIAVEEWDVDERGLRYDRRWMLVDEANQFISQRELPRMALIRVRIEPDGLVVGSPGMSPLAVPFRPVDPDYGKPGDRVGLADGFPFLLISEASLADLNARLEQPLPMNRFRPNLVIGGCEPFAEDGWSRVRIGSITFRVVKPCSRCAITTVDQTTAVAGKEPLRTLARFRKVGDKVLFGQNLIHDGTGTLRTDDPVEILQTR